MEAITRSVARRTCLSIFRNLGGCPRNVCEPTFAQPLRALSRDGVSIEGRYRLPDGPPQGTVLLGHGFCSCVFEEWMLTLAQEVAASFQLAVCACDFRNHGLSGEGVPTFGTAESWDMCAFMNTAQGVGLPTPFIVIGQSLGGMAAQRLAVEDSRVVGAAMLSTPGWAWDAIGKASDNLRRAIRSVLEGTPLLAAPMRDRLGGHGQRLLLSFANMINIAYGQDVLVDGDLRIHPAVPAHKPLMLYVMGDRDEYDYRRTLEIYRHLYPEDGDSLDELPSVDSGRCKWFLRVPGAIHPAGDSGYCVWDWPAFRDSIHRFVQLALKRAGER